MALPISALGTVMLEPGAAGWPTGYSAFDYTCCAVLSDYSLFFGQIFMTDAFDARIMRMYHFSASMAMLGYTDHALPVPDGQDELLFPVSVAMDNNKVTVIFGSSYAGGTYPDALVWSVDCSGAVPVVETENTWSSHYVTFGFDAATGPNDGQVAVIDNRAVLFSRKKIVSFSGATQEAVLELSGSDYGEYIAYGIYPGATSGTAVCACWNFTLGSFTHFTLTGIGTSSLTITDETPEAITGGYYDLLWPSSPSLSTPRISVSGRGVVGYDDTIISETGPEGSSPEVRNWVADNTVLVSCNRNFSVTEMSISAFFWEDNSSSHVVFPHYGYFFNYSDGARQVDGAVSLRGSFIARGAWGMNGSDRADTKLSLGSYQLGSSAPPKDATRLTRADDVAIRSQASARITLRPTRPIHTSDPTGTEPGRIGTGRPDPEDILGMAIYPGEPTSPAQGAITRYGQDADPILTYTLNGFPQTPLIKVRAETLVTTDRTTLAAGPRDLPWDVDINTGVRFLPEDYDDVLNIWHSRSDSSPSGWTLNGSVTPITYGYRRWNERWQLPALSLEPGQFLTADFGGGTFSSGCTISMVAVVHAPLIWSVLSTADLDFRADSYWKTRYRGASAVSANPVYPTNVTPYFLTITVAPPLVTTHISTGPDWTRSFVVRGTSTAAISKDWLIGKFGSNPAVADMEILEVNVDSFARTRPSVLRLHAAYGSIYGQTKQ